MIHINNNLYAKLGRDEVIALFDSRNISVAYIKPKVSLTNEKEIVKFIKELYNNKQIFFEDMSSNNKLPYISQINIKQMVLLVSNQCNYNCKYCQIEKNLSVSNKVNMSIETAVCALNVFKKNSNADLERTLTITGGEPLINYEVTSFIIQKAREMFPHIRIVMFTNGSLVDRQIAKYLAKHNIEVIVSIDGPAILHNSNRIDLGGGGTFNRTLQGYRILQEENCHIGISSVGGIHNINSYQELLSLYLNLSPDSVGYNIPHSLLEKDNQINIPIQEFTNMLIQLYLGLRKEGIYLENISRIINSFANKSSRITECQAQGRGFTVDARGMVGPCKSLVINDIFSVVMTDDMQISEIPIFIEWANRSPLHDMNCINCPARKLCGGGCAYDSYIRYNGDFMHIDERMCEYHMGILEFLLDDLYNFVKSNIVVDELYVVDNIHQKEAFMQYIENEKLLHKSVGHE